MQVNAHILSDSYDILFSMSGINFADTIVIRRVANKGTKIVQEPLKSTGIFGEEAKKRDMARLKLAGDLMIMSSKGTTSLKASEVPETATPNPKGHYITTGKGTGRVKV